MTIQSTSTSIRADNLCTPFFESAQRRPEDIAIVFEDREFRYSDLVAQVDATIDLLFEVGIKPGDRVAILSHNHPAIIVTLYAIARVGAILLPLNPRCTLEEIKKMAADTDVSIFFFSAATMPIMTKLYCNFPDATFIGIEKSYDDWPILSISSISGTPEMSRHPLCETGQDTLAVLLYTSGTTGDPKGVMITHGNIGAMLTNVHLTTNITNTAVVLSIAPLFHVGSFSYALAALAIGGKVVILPSFDTDDVYKALKKWSPTFTFCVPTMLFELEKHHEFNSHDFPNLMIMAAGAPVPIDTLRKWLGRGVQITQGYGMTEGGSTILDANRSIEKVGSAGIPSPLTEVQIRDLDNNIPITEPGISGQIFMRGAAISQGYWNSPEETAATFDSEGWLASGDIGQWDEDGYIYIVDRLKDMIISGGMNVYPAEIEKVLCGHDYVTSAAVIGLPDDKWGERVTAVVVLKDNESAEAEDLRAYCREKISHYKVPRQFEFVKALPLGPSGKILKGELRDRFIT